MVRGSRFLGIVPILMLCTSVANAQDDTVAKFEKYLDACADVDGFSGSVLVARDGAPVFTQGYGYANIETHEPNRPWTRFRLGSVTKAFTAMAVLILKEQGKLALDDPVGKYIEDAPDAWKPVTIRHLLTHTSGIPNFTSHPDYVARIREVSTPTSTIKRFKDKPLDFEPGSKFAYSNSGYVLLGAIIEKVSGQRYRDFLKANIFDPLGMSHTDYDDTAAIVPNRAAGYAGDLETDSVKNAAFLDMSIPHAAGALASTVGDLAIWDRALRDGKLISKESYDELYKPVHNDYAFGWVVRTRDGHRMIGHGGGINGFATELDRYPDDKLCVVVLSNFENAPSARIARDLAEIAFGNSVEPPKRRKTIALSAEAIAPFVGQYQLGPGAIFTVTADDDRLFGQLTGQPRVRLFASAPREFFVKVVDAVIEFAEPADGAAPSMVLKQGGRETRADRVESKADSEGDSKP